MVHSFFVLLKKEIIDYKQPKNLVLLGVFIFFAAGSPIMVHLLPMILIASGQYDPGIVELLPKMDLASIMSSYIGGLSQLGFLAIAFIFAGSIAEERSSGTTALILVKSVDRRVYIFSKMISAAILITILSVISTVILAYTTWVFIPQYSLVNLIYSSLLISAFNMFIAILAVEFGAIFKNQIVAGVCVIVLSIILGILRMILSKELTVFLPSSMHDKAIEIANGVIVWNNIWPSLIGGVVLLAVFCIVSILIFSKAEL